MLPHDSQLEQAAAALHRLRDYDIPKMFALLPQHAQQQQQAAEALFKCPREGEKLPLNLAQLQADVMANKAIVAFTKCDDPVDAGSLSASLPEELRQMSQ